MDMENVQMLLLDTLVTVQTAIQERPVILVSVLHVCKKLFGIYF